MCISPKNGKKMAVDSGLLVVAVVSLPFSHFQSVHTITLTIPKENLGTLLWRLVHQGSKNDCSCPLLLPNPPFRLKRGSQRIRQLIKYLYTIHTNTLFTSENFHRISNIMKKIFFRYFMQERDVAGINALVSNNFLLRLSFWVVSYGYKPILYGKKTHGFIEWLESNTMITYLISIRIKTIQTKYDFFHACLLHTDGNVIFKTDFFLQIWLEDFLKWILSEVYELFRQKGGVLLF